MAGPISLTPQPGRRTALWVWLVGMLVAAVVTARSHYVADLSAFLPTSPTAQQAVLLDQLRTGVGSRLVLIGIEGGSAEARIAASRQWADELRRSGAFDSVNNGDNLQNEAFGKFLFEHRYLLSPAIDAKRFTADGLREAIDETVSLLGTPAGSMLKPIILRDPTGETVRMAETMLPSRGPRSDGGVWVSREQPRAVLVATTRADGADLDAQQAALDLLQTSFAPYRAQGLQLLVSGAGKFAVESRAQIKEEVERLAIVGTVVAVALLLLTFGSIKALGIALLPVASGVLAGITAVSLGFGHVHGITLGFGTTLIGEAVDYGIYYLIQAHAAPSDAPGRGAQRWLNDNWPIVRLGLMTSLCGFAALVFSGFPGLAQLGVFSIAGLLAGAFTTRWVFPILAPNGAPGGGLRQHLGRATGRLVQALPRARWPMWLATAVAAVALAVLPSPWRGQLSSLSPVSEAAMKLNEDLRADVGAAEGGALIAVSAADEAGALALAEAAGQRLDVLVAQGQLLGYDSPARLLPSPATQLARRAAIPDAETLRAQLAAATAQGPLSADRLGTFIEDTQAARGQALLTRASLDGSPLSHAVDAMLSRGDGTRPWRALINLQATEQGIDPEVLRRAVANVPSAQVVDIGNELAALYARYLREAGVQALLGGLAVLVLLAWQLRSWRRLAAVAQPLVASVVLVMAGLSAAGVALGILHLVGFLLVVAIGSNYALFFDQRRHPVAAGRVGSGTDTGHLNGADHSDSDTLASLALANLTTVLSFVLLAMSSIPALYSIGQVVAPGALLSLLLSAAFMPAVPAAGRPTGSAGGKGYGKLSDQSTAPDIERAASPARTDTGP